MTKTNRKRNTKTNRHQNPTLILLLSCIVIGICRATNVIEMSSKGKDMSQHGGNIWSYTTRNM
jgi:hypothetical protein